MDHGLVTGFGWKIVFPRPIENEQDVHLTATWDANPGKPVLHAGHREKLPVLDTHRL